MKHHRQVPSQCSAPEDIRCQHPGAVLLLLCLLSIPAARAGDTLDCAKKSLGDAIAAGKPGSTIAFTGICGPIAIRRDGLKVTGVGTAIIEGGGGDAVTISAASGVTLADVEVRNGLNGILAKNGRTCGQ